VKDCSPARKRQEAQKRDLMNSFEPARVSLKVNERLEITANADDADSVTTNEVIAASRNVSLDEQYA